MARRKKQLPAPGGRLQPGYSRLAQHYKLHGMTEKEAKEYAHAVQDITAMHQWGAISKDEMADLFYDLYDEILEDFDIDMHDPDFYPRKS